MVFVITGVICGKTNFFFFHMTIRRRFCDGVGRFFSQWTNTNSVHSKSIEFKIICWYANWKFITWSTPYHMWWLFVSTTQYKLSRVLCITFMVLGQLCETFGLTAWSSDLNTTENLLFILAREVLGENMQIKTNWHHPFNLHEKTFLS